MEPAKQNLILKTQPTDSWKRVNERKEKNWLVVWKIFIFRLSSEKVYGDEALWIPRAVYHWHFIDKNWTNLRNWIFRKSSYSAGKSKNKIPLSKIEINHVFFLRHFSFYNWRVHFTYLLANELKWTQKMHIYQRAFIRPLKNFSGEKIITTYIRVWTTFIGSIKTDCSKK